MDTTTYLNVGLICFYLRQDLSHKIENRVWDKLTIDDTRHENPWLEIKINFKENIQESIQGNIQNII